VPGLAVDRRDLGPGLDIPLGVIRILVSDMRDGGLVRVHRPSGAEHQPDLGLLERVLYGLRNI
jgi:hypothetical protein